MNPLVLFLCFAVLGGLVSLLTEFWKRACGLRGNVLQTITALQALAVALGWVGVTAWGWDYLPLVWGGMAAAAWSWHEVLTDRNPEGDGGGVE